MTNSLEMKDDMEFISRLEEIMPAEELDFDPTPSFGPWRHLFPREAKHHPAKANLHLLKFFIETWTRPGDVVLDPMAGTYSTCVIAALAGRIGIGVDIEEKFYKWGLEAKRLAESATVTPKGRMIVLRGDARRLTELLSQAAAGDIATIITSPPYLKSADHGAGINKQREKDVKIGCSTIGRVVTHPEAIDNVGDYGMIDVVITSPYSSSAIQDYGTSNRALEGGLMIRNDKPTYLSEMLKVYREMYKVLRPHGLAIVIVKPFYRRRKVIDLPYHSFLLMKAVGFGLEKLYKLRLKNQSFWRILLYKKYPDLPRLNHEYVLVMRRNA